MENNIVLSIILPVYNVEKYIQRCLDSIYNGLSVPLGLFEVIFIDDESPDNSVVIIENNRKIYSNIRLISQKNKRAGGARNTGIKNSKGKYLWFIDPDDTIVKDVINKFIPYLKECSLDIVMCNNNIIYQNKIIPDIYSNKSEIIDGETHYLRNRVTWSPCLSFYRKQFILDNNLFFQENVSFEDIDWVLKSQLMSQKLICFPDIIYNYYKNDTSQTTTNPSFNKVNDWFFMAKRISEINNIKNAVSNIIEAHSILAYKRGIRSLLFLKYSERNILYDKYLKKNIFKDKKLNFISQHVFFSKMFFSIMHPIVCFYKIIRDRNDYK